MNTCITFRYRTHTLKKHFCSGDTSFVWNTKFCRPCAQMYPHTSFFGDTFFAGQRHWHDLWRKSGNLKAKTAPKRFVIFQCAIDSRCPWHRCDLVTITYSSYDRRIEYVEPYCSINHVYVETEEWSVKLNWHLIFDGWYWYIGDWTLIFCNLMVVVHCSCLQKQNMQVFPCFCLWCLTMEVQWREGKLNKMYLAKEERIWMLSEERTMKEIAPVVRTGQLTGLL